MDARDGAWNAFHDALPEGWNVGRLSHDPGRHAWTIVARSPQPVRRRGAPEYLEGAGEDEIAVLTYLALALEARQANAKRADIRQRGRLAYLQAAEEASRRSQGRGLTGEELERVIERRPDRLLSDKGRCHLATPVRLTRLRP